MRRYRNNKKYILSLILLCITVCLSACSDTKDEDNDNDKNADGNVSVSVSLSETERGYCETLPYIIEDHSLENDDIYYPAQQTEYDGKGILYHEHLR